MHPPSMLEIEVKFLVLDHAPVRERLMAAGGRPARPRVREVNLRFDDPRATLGGEGKILRLRQDDRARLTLKRRPAGKVVSEVRSLEELEVEVADLETARAILEGVGFQVVVMYEKYRETHHLGPVEVVLDELPYGNFVELEGPDEAALRQSAEALGLRWDRRFAGSYLSLFERARRKHGLKFRDLTFANFAGLRVSPAELGLEPAFVES